jgi:phage-related protein
MPSEKPVHWIGSSKKDLLAFPSEAVSNIGYALGVAQLGGKHPAAKPWKGEGPGVLEIVEDFDGDTYRLLYTVRFAEAIYALHAFQKKSPKGIATPAREIELVRQRLKLAQAAHEVAEAANRKDRR